MPSPRLRIGPLLRRVVGTRATVWVETSAPAVAAVRTADGATGTAKTFSAYDHQYAIVVVAGLTPDSATTYEVLIDDEAAWPVPASGFPPSVIRTRAADDRDQPVTLLFGSCREATQHATGRKLPPDALDAYARRLIADPDPAALPDLLVLLGDQVYADITSRAVRKLLGRPQPGAGGDAPADAAGLESGAGRRRPGPRALRRGTPGYAGVRRPSVRWKKLTGPLLRQRGDRPDAPGPFGRGGDRGHHRRRRPPRGGTAAPQRPGMSTLCPWTITYRRACVRWRTS